MDGLASKGHHQVTVMSFFNESKTPGDDNYTDIGLQGDDSVEVFVDNITPDEAGTTYSGIVQYIKILMTSTIEKNSCQVFYTHRYVRDMLSGKIPPPDLIMAESFHVPCFGLLAEKFEIPLIDRHCWNERPFCQ